MITAIILAAGKSKRMGQQKMLLPWGNKTVLAHVISTFSSAGIDDILVVTGGAQQQVERSIQHLNVKTVFNNEFNNGEMLSSIQCGIRSLTRQTQAVLIGLGDQPQIQVGSVRKVCETYRNTASEIVVPSYQMRRGHPWLVTHPLFNELLSIKSPQSPREFLNAHHTQITYANVDDPGILADLDTPKDYQKWNPNIS